MIILKHYKVDDVSYVSHKDILRVLQRGLKRAGVDVKYSQGYVPHMLTYTTTPVPLGVQSVAEYFAFECVSNVDKDDILLRYNKSMPTGMRAVASFYKDRNPNLAGIVVASDYIAESVEIAKRDRKYYRMSKLRDIDKQERANCEKRRCAIDIYVESRGRPTLYATCKR